MQDQNNMYLNVINIIHSGCCEKIRCQSYCNFLEKENKICIHDKVERRCLKCIKIIKNLNNISRYNSNFFEKKI